MCILEVGECVDVTYKAVLNECCLPHSFLPQNHHSHVRPVYTTTKIYLHVQCIKALAYDP